MNRQENFGKNMHSHHEGEQKKDEFYKNRQEKQCQHNAGEEHCAGAEQHGAKEHNAGENDENLEKFRNLNGCAHGDGCTCGDQCDCGDECTYGEECNCGEACDCGETCDCGENCECGEHGEHDKHGHSNQGHPQGHQNQQGHHEQGHQNQHGQNQQFQQNQQNRQGQPNAQAQQAQQYLEMAQRLQADFDNYRKRVAEQLEYQRSEGKRSVIEVFLPCLDTFAEAKKSISDEKVLEGINMIENKILQALSGLKVEKIEAVGQKFNPHLHNAIAFMQDKNAENEVVLQEYQAGWTMDGRVIRYSKVVVNKL